MTVTVVSCFSLASSLLSCVSLFFFFNDTATTEIYTLSLHDALPIYRNGIGRNASGAVSPAATGASTRKFPSTKSTVTRSEEHTSELQSRLHLVCRLLLEKKKTTFIVAIFPVQTRTTTFHITSTPHSL